MKITKISLICFLITVLIFSCRKKLSSNEQMVELLQQQDKFESNASNVYSCAAVLQHLDSLISLAPNGTNLLQLNINKANVLLQLGKEVQAVHLLDSLNKTFIPIFSDRKTLIKTLALAYLRLGERTNCINNHTAESCIFPIKGSGIQINKYGSESAISIYEKMLKENSGDYESRWLLNIAYMTIGAYPTQVPPAYLLKIDDNHAASGIKPFKDVAMNLGLAIRKLGGGVIIDDFNNDNYPDIITSSSSLKEHMHYFRNNGNGTFTDVSESSGLAQFTGGLNIIQTDYNNDGFKDIFVLRGAWKGKFGKDPNSLLRNNGDGTFTDVTAQAGLLSLHPTQTATWADFNNDGWLDLFIGNESEDGDINPSELYINNKNGTFTEVATRAGCDVKLFVKGVTSGDYDNDGRTDLFISTMNGKNILLKNITEKNGPVKFKDVTRAANLGNDGPSTFATWFWDYDNDGWPDILVCGYGNRAQIATIAAAEAMNQYQGNDGKVILYHNQHDGTFKDVSKEAGLDKVSFAMGANFGDIDNDGFLDFYLGTGNPMFTSIIPNKLYKNDAGHRFIDITSDARVGSLQKGHAIAFADMNNDGNEDIFINQGGAFPGDAYQNALFINPGQKYNHWENISLEGLISNKAAIGARLKIFFTENGKKRNVFRDINSGGSFGANPLMQHVGLGSSKKIDTLEIKWPVTGVIQRFTNIAGNQNIKIKEGVNKLTIYKLSQFNFNYLPMVNMKMN